MITSYLLILLVHLSAIAIRSTYCSIWSLTADFRGSQFLSEVDYITSKTVTASSLAKYISLNEAQNSRLVYIDQNKNDAFIIRVDNSSLNTPTRNSVRLQSRATYGDGLIVIDLNHTPQGCGVWPAFWTRTRNGTSNQEVDIIENVNDLKAGHVLALHTDTSCSIRNSSLEQKQLGRFGTSLQCQQSDHPQVVRPIIKAAIILRKILQVLHLRYQFRGVEI